MMIFRKRKEFLLKISEKLRKYIGKQVVFSQVLSMKKNYPNIFNPKKCRTSLKKQSLCFNFPQSRELSWIQVSFEIIRDLVEK